MKYKKRHKLKDYEENETFSNEETKFEKNNCKIHWIIYVLLIILIFLILLIFLLHYLKNKQNIINSMNFENNIKKYDYIIVGAGLYGATFNYFAKKAGKKTLVLEKRSHIGGNLHCENYEGINVNKYGPHIFHTNNKKIWDFVNTLTNFIPYNQQTRISYNKKVYDLPFNIWSFNHLFYFNETEGKSNKEINNFKNQSLSPEDKETYLNLIKKYLEKQWYIKNENLPSFINDKIPTKFIFDENFFNDKYQGIPENCYNSMMEKLLQDTEVITGIDYNIYKDKYKDLADKIVYTGKIDEYFNCIFGKLEYRTIKWENEVIDKKEFQDTAIINYLDNNIPYSRVIEYKHLNMNTKEIQENGRTIIFYEYSKKWNENRDPFLPIYDEKNINLYNKYKELADKEKNVIFGGRLAEYKYYDMEKIIEKVFKYWNI